MQGSRIQAVMFTETIAKFKDLFIKDRTYFVSNGEVKPTNPRFASAHKEIELALTIQSDVKEAETSITLLNESYNFTSFKDAIIQRDETKTYGIYLYLQHKYYT